MPNLDLKGLLASVRLALPPTALLETFAQFSMLASDRLHSPESRTTAALRDTLLSRLLSGEIRIRPSDGAASANT